MHADMQIDEHRRPHFDVELPPSGLPLVEAMAAAHANLYVHYSGHYAFSGEPYPYRDLQQVGERLLAAFGANRMLMASDWPWIEFEPGYSRILAVVDELLPGITAAERDAIRGGTAMSLFRF
jgi:L-fuconolactonase